MTMDEYMNALLSDEVMNEERSMFKKARDYGREEGIDIGMSQGINIGKSQGISIGMSQGIDIGKSEGKKEERNLIAKELLKMNFSLEKISAATGLSKEELEKMCNSQIK